MRYRELGTTGLKLSESGFGAGDNAGLMIAGSLEEQCRVLNRALEHGINYIDTAAGYGNNQSETNLGKVLKEIRLRPLINTKVEVTLQQASDVASAVESSVEGSLKRLGVDYVDIVQIHNSPVFHRPDNYSGGGWLPMTIDEWLGPKGAVEGLHRLREAGKARVTGFINERPDVALAKVLIATGEFSLLNVQYNLLNPTAGMPKPRGLEVDLDNGNVITYAAEHGVGTAIFRPLGGGVLTDRALAGGPPHPLARDSSQRNPDAYNRVLRRARMFQFLSREGRTLAQAAIQFILLHPGVTTVLGGFTAVEQVDDIVAAQEAPPLSETDLVRLQTVWDGNFGEG